MAHLELLLRLKLVQNKPEHVSMECYYGVCDKFVGLTFRRTQSEKGRVITTSNQDIMNNIQPHTPIPSLDILLSSETKQLAVF